ncbi:hypothetical protein CBM2623_B120076 [Cupriavidus taiwanensis]|nr:hypothetical protein CBM2608_B130075 [Cupriavidus taiwanensis]SPA32142.1 hypothetical protein CBM2623_B120076 [Cupriavidus taiwanensis]
MDVASASRAQAGVELRGTMSGFSPLNPRALHSSIETANRPLSLVHEPFGNREKTSPYRCHGQRRGECCRPAKVHLSRDAGTHTPDEPEADFPLLADAVAQGLGIGLLPAYVSRCASYHALQPVLPDFRIQADPQSLYIMTLPSRYPSPATRTLIEFLRERIGLLIRGPQPAVPT